MICYRAEYCRYLGLLPTSRHGTDLVYRHWLGGSSVRPDARPIPCVIHRLNEYAYLFSFDLWLYLVIDEVLRVKFC